MSNESRNIIIVMYLLIAVGIVMIYSASAVFSDQIFGSATYFFRRQLFYLVLGTLVFCACMGIDPDWLQKHSRRLVISAILFLALVFIPGIGHTGGGARRWIGLSAFNFQPVEFGKLAICLYLSDYLTRKIKPLTEGEPSVLVPPLAVLLVVLSLLIVQPDLGSCIFIVLVSGILFFLAGIKPRYIIIAVIPVLAAVSVLIIKAPYRLNRIVAFLDPWKDPSGSGFQIIQSFVAFASGGWKGVGLGESTQKLFYLPQSYTDFIFSIIGEELGFMGACTVLLLYGVFFLLGIRISGKCREPFYRLFSYSLVLIVTLQALINVLVTIGLIPTKGLPLPFVSYGGTSLIFNMTAVGLLVAIDRKSASRSFHHE